MAGECRFATQPTVLATILGSCVAVCLWDRQRRIGGMNHFVLPVARHAEDGARYGDIAIDELQAGLAQLGSRLCDVQAKVFGGAAVLPHAGRSIGTLNVKFAISRLSRQGIPIIAQRTGGTLGQQIRFNTGTGEVLFRHLQPAEVRDKAYPAVASSGQSLAVEWTASDGSCQDAAISSCTPRSWAMV